jgi:DNA-directed RNA polymerase specialized sigma24 family protein
MEHSNELLLSKDDAHAFTKLYELYWEKLYVIARNRLNDPALAEDIVHDVFLAPSRHGRKHKDSWPGTKAWKQPEKW